MCKSAQKANKRLNPDFTEPLLNKIQVLNNFLDYVCREIFSNPYRLSNCITVRINLSSASPVFNVGKEK